MRAVTNKLRIIRAQNLEDVFARRHDEAICLLYWSKFKLCSEGL